MAGEASGFDLGHAVVLLAAAVVAVPVFRRLGLGGVLGYLAAGLAIGPFGLGLFGDPHAILHTAELGVVLFLFLIGLEMRPAKLWAMRKDIFGLGAAQVATAGGALTLVGMAAGLTPVVAFVGAMGFVLSSTAVIMKMLEERGEAGTPSGQKAVSILLFEDLSIVPLLAIVAVIAALTGSPSSQGPSALAAIGTAIAALAGLIVAGRFLLNPMFRILATYGGREVMTAAALLVVLGAAAGMQAAGLSMAMGAFLAGVLLSESTFRHQLEADVEPFRGILLGLFFLSVGMSLDLALVLADWPLIFAGVGAFMVVKAIAIYAIARVFKSDHREALMRAALFAQGGEFAFVLYGAALSAGVWDARSSAAMTAIVILSMALTPLVLIAMTRIAPKPKAASMDGVEEVRNLSSRILIIGFGRFAQVVSQPLLARACDISIIDKDVEMIQAAGRFGFKVYYGDGARLDVLRASGAERAEAILICVDNAQAADHIVELCKDEFPHAKLFARAYDRGHALRLIKAGVDYQIRETFESAMAFGGEVLTGLGFEPSEVAETMDDVRTRDGERLALQLAGDMLAGRALLRGNIATPEPAPLIKPRREGAALNPEAEQALKDKGPKAPAPT